MADENDLPLDPDNRYTNDDNRPQRSGGHGGQGSGGDFSGHVPNELQNWRVVADLPVQPRPPGFGAQRGTSARHDDADIDFDGQAHDYVELEDGIDVVDGSANDVDGILHPHAGPAAAAGSAQETGHDRIAPEPVIDSVVVAGVAPGPHRLNPGGRLELEVGLVNNGDAVARFHVEASGWGDPAWITVHPTRRKLMPGERDSVMVTVAPPRSPLATAGVHELQLEIQAGEYPGRQTRLPVLLEITPYDDVLLTDLQPARLRVTAGARVARSAVSIFNNGNRPVSVRISGLSPDLHCDFSFMRADGRQAPTGRLPLREEYAEEMTLELAPAEWAPVRVAVRPRRIPFIGLHDRKATIRIVAGVLGKSQVPRAASGHLACSPFLGALHLGVGLLLLFLAFFMVVMLGAVGVGVSQLIAERNVPRALPVQPQPQVVIVVPVNEQVPPPAPAGAEPVGAPADTGTAAGAPGTTAAGGESARDPSVPLVDVGQVSAPGAPASAARPVAPAAPAAVDRADMTYAQLFQEIGGKYDLDWRMLAAQAYVESRFDTLALGNAGDLGLMQVLPGTWQEWAPAADVNDPFDAYSNVLVAAAYLDYLRGLFAARGLTEDHWMLVAYNWGPDKVLSLVDGGNDWMDLDPGMRQYALDVLSLADTIPFD